MISGCYSLCVFSEFQPTSFFDLEESNSITCNNKISFFFLNVLKYKILVCSWVRFYKAKKNQVKMIMS